MMYKLLNLSTLSFADLAAQARTLALTFLVGATGGAIFQYLNMPIPWLLGSLFVTMLATLAGANLGIAGPVRNLALAILGTAIGAAFKPDLLDRVGTWPISLIVSIFVAVVFVPMAHFLMRKLLRVDPVTALVSTVPGAFSAMVLVARDYHADVSTVTISHATRVMVVVMTVPFFVASSSAPDTTAGAVATTFPLGIDLVVLIACAVFGPLIAMRLRLPAAVIMGAMLMSALVHLFGVTDASIPREIVSFVQIITGAWLGGRFRGSDHAVLLRNFLVSTLITMCALIPVFAFAWILAALTSMQFLPLVLAFAPGGMPEMALVALSLDLDSSFVIAHHLFRMLVILIAAPPLIAWYKRRYDTVRQ